MLVNVDVKGGAIVERYQVARKVTDLGGGLWHYEYAVHNLNSDRAASAFTVEFPLATAFTNVGFKGIATTPASPTRPTTGPSATTPNTLTWSTAPFATNPNAHALRWSTMFNFWFDADQPPTARSLHTLDLFTPGDPATLEVDIADAFNNGFKDSFETGDLVTWSAHVGPQEKDPKDCKDCKTLLSLCPCSPLCPCSFSPYR